MPFLPLYFQQLGVRDIGHVAVWSGVSLAVTPALTAIVAPLWGRVGDRFGRKLLLVRSLASFVVVMTATAFAWRPWHVFALRAAQGLFAGYGALAVTMAAESAPDGRMARSIGVVQTAQRLGPTLGPLLGGVVAGLFGIRRAFLIAALFYGLACVLVLALYREPARHLPASEGTRAGHVSFRSVLAFRNFLLLMGVVFGLQFADRSFDPVLALYVAQLGTPAARIPMVAGALFSTLAASAAIGHHLAAGLIRRGSASLVIAGGAVCAAAALILYAAAPPIGVLLAGSALFGVAIGVATTAAYTAAGTLLPAGAQGVGFGFLTTASLIGLAASPLVGGFLAATSIRAVFVLNTLGLIVLAAVVWRLMREKGVRPAVRAAPRGGT